MQPWEFCSSVCAVAADRRQPKMAARRRLRAPGLPREGTEPASLLKVAGVLQGRHRCVREIRDDASQWCQLIGAGCGRIPTALQSEIPARQAGMFGLAEGRCAGRWAMHTMLAEAGLHAPVIPLDL